MLYVGEMASGVIYSLGRHQSIARRLPAYPQPTHLH